MLESHRDVYLVRVLEAANRGAQQAIETHRRMGRSIVVWQDEKVVKLKPQDIPPRPLLGDEQ
jgi:hypothetical protein